MWEPIAKELGLPWYTVESLYWKRRKERSTAAKRCENKWREKVSEAPVAPAIPTLGSSTVGRRGESKPDVTNETQRAENNHDEFCTEIEDDCSDTQENMA
jgi:hypothetical protein